MSHLPGRSWCPTVKSTPREISALEKMKRNSATPAFLLCPGGCSRPSFPRIFQHTSSPAPCWTVPNQPSPESHRFLSTCTISKFWPSHHSVRFQNRFLTHVPDTAPSANLPPSQDSIERWPFANYASFSFSPFGNGERQVWTLGAGVGGLWLSGVPDLCTITSPCPLAPCCGHSEHLDSPEPWASVLRSTISPFLEWCHLILYELLPVFKTTCPFREKHNFPSHLPNTDRAPGSLFCVSFIWLWTSKGPRLSLCDLMAFTSNPLLGI